MQESFPSIDVGEERISYQKTGQGPPLLCLHGWAGYERTFDSILPYFNLLFYPVIGYIMLSFVFKTRAVRAIIMRAFPSEEADGTGYTESPPQETTSTLAPS